MALCSASCYAPRAPADHKRGYFAPAQQPPRFSLYQRIGVGQIKFAREPFYRARAFLAGGKRAMRNFFPRFFFSFFFSSRRAIHRGGMERREA